MMNLDSTLPLRWSVLMEYGSWSSVLGFVFAFIVVFVILPLGLSTLIIGWRSPEHIRRYGS